MATSSEKKNGGVWRAVFVIALIVFLASVVALGVIAYSYFQGQAKYNETAQKAGLDASDVSAAPLAELNVDWKALLEANPDTVAWVLMPNTSINYPVVRGADNEYYLTHDFDGEAGWLANYGAVFMDYRNNPNWSDQQYFIYGHHMNDGSMFADLAGLTDQARFDECRTVYMLSPHGNFKLRTFAMVHDSADAAIVQTSFANPADMAAYIQDKIDQSVVNPGEIPAASAIKQAFAFATCDNMYADGRYILYAYVEQTTAEGLTGDLGIETQEGETNGFVNDLTVENT